MKVTVIIPTFNRAGIIGRALDSIREQTYDDIETIVVDDCSSDNTEEFVRSHPLKPRYIKHNVNSGSSAARNTGIKNARGRYVTFLDSDDYYLPKKIEKQLRSMEAVARPESTLHFCQTYVKTRGFTTIAPSRAAEENELFGDYILSNNNFIQTNTIMVSTYLAKNVLFDESIHQWDDLSFCMRLVSLGHADIFMLAEPLVVYVNESHSGRITENVDYFMLKRLLNKNTDLISRKTRLRMLALFSFHTGFPSSIPETLGRVFQAVLAGAISPGYGLTILAMAITGKERALQMNYRAKQLLRMRAS
jgi:glycosyltransferase involved in cell wall biosynthesis